MGRTGAPPTAVSRETTPGATCPTHTRADLLVHGMWRNHLSAGCPLNGWTSAKTRPTAQYGLYHRQHQGGTAVTYSVGGRSKEGKLPTEILLEGTDGLRRPPF